MIEVIRPWGSYQVLLDTPNYKVKKLVVNPDMRLSLQRHKLREEFWTIVEGRGQYIFLDKMKRVGAQTLESGDYVHIPKNSIHRLQAFEQKLVVIEVQVGICLEDDIDRLEDDFGRA